jgi:hypothetical protein
MKKIKYCLLAFFLITLSRCFIVGKKHVDKQWSIDKYKIKLISWQGMFGPRYYYYRLDENSSISAVFFKSRKVYELLSVCNLSFNKRNETKYTFDICTNKPTPVKTSLEPAIIRSIEVLRIDSLSVKSVFLNDNQKQIFIDSWNQARRYTRGSPRIKYLVKVDQGGSRTFNSDGYFLYEQPQDAKYKFADTSFFGSLFIN